MRLCEVVTFTPMQTGTLSRKEGSELQISCAMLPAWVSAFSAVLLYKSSGLTLVLLRLRQQRMLHQGACIMRVGHQY